MPASQPLVVLGTGPFAAELADVAGEDDRFEVVGFVENERRERCAELLDGLPIHWIDDVGPFAPTHLAICGLGTTRRARFIAQAAEMGLRFATVVHPTARVSSKSTLGEGTIVSAGVLVAAHTAIGRHVLLNRGAIVGHHTTIGDYVSIHPGATVSGMCTVASGVYLAVGSIVVDRISIGADSIVGAGAVVTRDVPGRVQVQGVPARVVREGVDGR